ncbi:AAA family ATPase [Candidatus Woesearchaeota archaeon]|nr:AAA family ATPase [Candidatus Woesearchaeota archaeon]
MHLKSIKLSNIRSYTNAQIDFPKGSVLLAGDIGAGKSSILLAIEFALFGAKPNELPASSLLRHGKKEGYVELNFDVDGKEYLIKRTLKRGSSGIVQGSGYIISEGIKKEGMPTELKAGIIELFGYPKDAASRSKDLIYRYTVYTPQEELKRILLEAKDVRLDTIRKVFNIDKYKAIRENSAVFVRGIKEKKREFEGFISDLSIKEKEKESLKADIAKLEKEIQNLAPRLEKTRAAVKEAKTSVEKNEEGVEQLNRAKKEADVLEVQLKNSLNMRERNKREIERLQAEIKSLEKEMQGKDAESPEMIKEALQKTDAEIKAAEKSIREIFEKKSELNSEARKAKEVKEKILRLSRCPMCEQDVSKEHKHAIDERESKKLREAEESIKAIIEKEKELDSRIDELRKSRDALRKKENSLEIFRMKAKSIEQYRKKAAELETEQDSIKKEIGKINMRKIELNQKLAENEKFIESYKKSKEAFQNALNEEKKAELESNSLLKEREGYARMLSNIEKEITRKKESKNALERLAGMQNWLEEFFVNLMGTMERHVMLQIYREFNELFREWFSTLVEDETLSVRLDDEFSPVIEQNGYETLFESLSGGERTAVALSYRLALNKVINDIVSGIKTKDLIILDEPTEGFSYEQLDRMRAVLGQLDMNQIIIVSHESKVESFVDNVIRVGKHEHESAII